MTVFGRAILEAIRGGASDPSSESVSLKHFFFRLYQNVQEILRKMNETKLAALIAEQERALVVVPDAVEEQTEGYAKKKRAEDAAAVVNKVSGVYDINRLRNKYVQTPTLYVPAVYKSSSTDATAAFQPYISSVICYRCGPPAPPQRPYIVRVGQHDVTLEWYNPPFDGVKPFKYRLQMQNVTRNFHHWEEVYYPGEIRKSKFIVRNLPMGIACQFRVCAFNNGGWGKYSEPTAYVTPGEENAVLPDHLRWKRLTQGGPLAILDRMELYPKHRNELHEGLKKLLAFGLCNSGFKSTQTSLHVAKTCMNILKEFKTDPELFAQALEVIRWALHGKAERKARFLCTSEGIEGIISEGLAVFRHNGAVVNAIQAVRSSTLSKYIQPVGEYKYKILFPTIERKAIDDDDFDSSDDEDGNEDLSQTSNLENIDK